MRHRLLLCLETYALFVEIAGRHAKTYYRPLSQCIIHETLRTDMSHARVTVIIYHAPLWDWNRYCQRASATFELCGWILEWLTSVW